jgi:phage-related minor tail protein
MDEEIERLVVAVRADTSGFARDVADMRAGLEGPLVSGAERAGRSIETALTRALVTGKFGFEELRSVALKVLAEIASAAVRGGLRELLGGIGQGGGERGTGAGGLLTGLVGALSGLPGRATGGPVAPGAAYWVGERGPELFVPTASGRVEAGLPPAAGAREVRVSITVNAARGEAPGALAQSSRQVARAVRSALLEG